MRILWFTSVVRSAVMSLRLSFFHAFPLDAKVIQTKVEEDPFDSRNFNLISKFLSHVAIATNH